MNFEVSILDRFVIFSSYCLGFWYGHSLVLEQLLILVWRGDQRLEDASAASHADLQHFEVCEGGIGTVADQGFGQGDPHLLAQLFAVVVDVAVFILSSLAEHARRDAVLFVRMRAQFVGGVVLTPS